MVIADIAAGHVLVLHAGDALAYLLTLDLLDVAEHAFFAEIAPCQIVGAERSGVVGGQRDEVVEYPRLAR